MPLRDLPEIPDPYEWFDVSRFSTSGAIYFMNGFSEARVRVLASGETLTFKWTDENTSIAASAPAIYSESLNTRGLYVAVPPPLRPVAYPPPEAAAEYRRLTTLHLLQVVSMNMRSADGASALLIGLPYAEKYPGLFRSTAVIGRPTGAASYGVVQSLTEYRDPVTNATSLERNGYPARSIFAVFHILETKIGVFFNKKPTVMELQPDVNGKLALSLPPIPFRYALANGPIPLFDVNDPNAPAIAEINEAHHESLRAATAPTGEDWPYKEIDHANIARRFSTWQFD